MNDPNPQCAIANAQSAFALIYRRVSTDHQDNSLQVQEALNDEYCHRMGLTVVSDYSDEDISGSIPFNDRLQGRALFNRLIHGDIQHVITSKQDRLGRDTIDAIVTVRRLWDCGITPHFTAEGGAFPRTSQNELLRLVAVNAAGQFISNDATLTVLTPLQFTYNVKILADPAGANRTFPTAIAGNSVVGYYEDSNTIEHGFLYNIAANSFTTLDGPAGNGTELAGISGNNIIGNNDNNPFFYNLATQSFTNFGYPYQDSFSGSSFVTNTWQFTVANYQNVFLPATPIYSENFDELEEATLPAGWVATNWTDIETNYYNLADPQSDSYLNWVVISVSDYAAAYPFTDDYVSPGEPEVAGNRRLMIPPIVLNGVLLTNLAEGNLIVAESDQRNDNQVQVLFTSDYDLTSVTNSYLSFHNLNEQNQDNICSVEYSINQGVTWLPLLYMLDDGTTDGDGSDVVWTNYIVGGVTLSNIDVNATFNTARNDQAHGLSYGAFIGAAITTNLIPAVRPCRNDDPVQQKRIEIFRLPLADGQSKVRFRFMQAGTGSWFFDFDDFAIYSINTPVISSQPQSVNVDGHTPASFSVTASGNGTLTYQWYFNGLKITGATNSRYSIASATAINVGQYQVIVQNADGPTKSSIANLTINTAPAITGQPVGELAAPGDNISFSVGATGDQPLSYQWYFNGALIPGAISATLPLASVQTNQVGNYTVSVANSYNSLLSVPATLKVYSGPLTSNLVVHLTFDGNLNDTSGRGNNATYGYYPAGNPQNTARFASGFIGQSFEYTTTKDRTDVEYATLGYPTDLYFGDSTDFSVSFWINQTNQSDDLSFISNKDWNSSSNPGWGIFSQSGGNYRVNVTGPNGGGGKYSETDTPLTTKDGNWHHIAVIIVRSPFGSSSYAYAYLDGVLVSKHPLTTAGSVDTYTYPFENSQGVTDNTLSTWAINIGQDGTGVYTDGGSASDINARMDDLGIWRRGLTANEVKGIYKAGLAGKDLSQATGLAKLLYTLSGNHINLTWAGSPTLKLQTSTTLGPNASWSDVSGTLGASSASVTITGTSAFFRLSQ